MDGVLFTVRVDVGHGDLLQGPLAEGRGFDAARQGDAYGGSDRGRTVQERENRL